MRAMCLLPCLRWHPVQGRQYEHFVVQLADQGRRADHQVLAVRVLLLLACLSCSDSLAWWLLRSMLNCKEPNDLS